MGGHAAGEVASAVAIAALAPLDEDAPAPTCSAALREAATSANDHLHDLVVADEALQGMGTTLVAVLFAGSRLGLLHVGDSRGYLLRDGELTQITHDHTFVQTLVDEGRITEEEASTHPQRNVITRVLDGRDDVELDLSVREVRVGDRYLLCSDGLTGPVGSLETLREALASTTRRKPSTGSCSLRSRAAARQRDRDRGRRRRLRRFRRRPVVVAGAAAESPQEAAPAGRRQPGQPRPGRRGPRRRGARHRDVRDDEPRPRARASPGALVVLVLGLLVAGGGAGWSYVRSQYFVGRRRQGRGLPRRAAAASPGVARHRPGAAAPHGRPAAVRGGPGAGSSSGIVATDLSDARAIVDNRLITRPRPAQPRDDTASATTTGHPARPPPHPTAPDPTTAPTRQRSEPTTAPAVTPCP